MGYLRIDVREIRGMFHAECKIGNKWVVKKFDHYPTEQELSDAFGM